MTKSSLGGNSGYTYDDNDRLKSDGKYSYGWDENGNLTSRSGSDGTTTYKYDPENRLIEASGPNGVTQFAYDAQGNRISRTTSSGITTFVVDPNMPYAQVLEESGPSGAKVYAYGNDMLNMQGPEGTRWFAYDGLGSTRALTDSTGTLTDAYTYEAFGTVVHRTGTSANDFQFTGEQYEAALDMYYLRARYYEPGTGRFESADTFPSKRSDPDTIGRYQYCLQDPTDRIDPSGKFSLAEISSTQAIEGTLRKITSIASRVFEIYDRIQTVIDMLDTVRTVFRFLAVIFQQPAGDLTSLVGSFGATTILDGLKQAYEKMGPNWRDLLDDIVEAIPAISERLFLFVGLRWAAYKAADKIGELRFILYVPSPPGKFKETIIKVNNKFGLSVATGGGRLFGLGVQIGNNQEEQLFRIDYWDTHQIPNSVKLHYHVQPDLGQHNYI